ncbi:UDP-glucuronosyltransferase 2B2-like isoform X2 [Spodoptera litura]|uniref:UDP-glucuronosyltransferase 2B2-like isoform X2 n=1 Tax=Spodoptera litura TaxID=69820 RepID=A0A9J7DM27_SPOLT|nr:UDP-glucuronosyltransferase 2B2-like isoform X2 [Spodoptera litura]
MLLSIVFIMIFASACEGYKILALLPYPGKSHFMVFEPILEELARRGHHVTVVSFFPSASPQANRRDVSLVGLAPLNVENLERWVSESRHGFILFSFGSLIRGSSLPPKRSEAILKVFARLPQRVLWKWETEDIKGLPDNVLVLKWLPQYDLLNHPNCVAFITHGGLLSLTEIVAAGVPALVIPILGDQPGNAAFAKRAGIAEVLEFHQIDEETFYNALMKVLTPEKRDHAKAFSSRWWERPLPPMETAIHYIENTAKYGYLNMSPPGRLMHKPELLFFMSIEYLVLFSLIFFIALLAKYFFCPQKIEKFKQS